MSAIVSSDRKNTEELIHGQQDQEQKQKKQCGEKKDTIAMAKNDNANDPNNDMEEKSSSWPSLPTFDSTTIILNQLTSSLSNVSTIPNVRSLRFSTGISWERRLQTLSMFSCSLAFVMPESLLCWITVLHFSLLLPFHDVFFVLNDNDNTDYDILPSWYKLKTATICVSIWIYMIHAFFIDTSPTTGSRVAWLRNGFGTLNWNRNWNWNWWNYACDYLPVVLV